MIRLCLVRAMARGFSVDRVVRAQRLAMVPLLAVVLLVAPMRAQALVGSTPASFQVTPTGAATYRIPIAVPPGTRGMQPALALAYSSQSGSGIAGVGWSIEGFSLVARCPRTVAQDGAAAAVKLDLSDRYCLDGMRLVAVTGADGADGTEYRTELETFTRVISLGIAGNGPAAFRAWTKDGRVIDYGATEDSRIEATGSSTPRAWVASKVQDASGNYFSISYLEDTPNGQYYPSRIDYTGNTGASVLPYNSVQFVYATRPDITTVYIAGAPVRTALRLTNVRTFAGASLVRDYQIAYDTSPTTTRSRVSSITECGGSTSDCLPPTTFGWIAGGGGNTQTDNRVQVAASVNVDISSVGIQPPGPLYVVGDFNGDGKADVYVLTAWAGGIFCGNAATSVNLNLLLAQTDRCASVLASFELRGGNDAYAGDFNGDGVTDLYLISDGTSRFCAGPEISQSDNCRSVAGSGGWRSAFLVLPGDYNGDGISDLYLVGDTASYFCAGPGIASANNCVQTAGAGWKSTYHITPGDYNGDGVLDLFLTGDGPSFFCPGPGIAVSNNCVTVAGSSGWKSAFRVHPGDYNGDGISDLYLVGDSASYFCAGPGIGGTNNCVQTAGAGWKAGYTIFPGDFNGDGTVDLFLLGDSGNFFCPGPANTSASTLSCTSLPNGGTSWRSGFVPLAGDFNGDGTADLLLMGATFISAVSGSYWTQTTPRGYFAAGGTGVPDLLASVANGLGARTVVTYGQLTDATLHTNDTAAVAFPIQNVMAPLYTAASVLTSDGIGGDRTTRYSYQGAKVHVQGRGFLGFKRI